MKLQSMIRISVCVILHIMINITIKNIAVSNEMLTIMAVGIEAGALRGILTQLQMLISIYIVLKEVRFSYVVALVMNAYSLLMSLLFLVIERTTIALPGTISYIGIILVITVIAYFKRKQLDNIDKMYTIAFFDTLTALPNRRLFMDRLEQSIHLAKRKGAMISVCFIDLDEFKSINDTMGHFVGDLVLKEIGKRLEASLRKEDTVSRFSGDEFLLSLSGFEKGEDIKSAVRKVLEIFEEPIVIDGIELFVPASVGVAIYPIDGESTDELIKHADLAMYRAKCQGKNQAVFCTQQIKEDVTRKMHLANSLYRALDKSELFLMYQPQIDVSTGQIIGVEALIRWRHETYGLVSPSEFIPLAEMSGLIRPIGLWVIRSVCETCHKCKPKHQEKMRISVNISIEQLKDPLIASKINQILVETDTCPEVLQVEVTESVASSEESFVLERLNEIKALGIAVAIDDFGTGHSSYSRLKKFPIDLIKIDMEFVQGIDSLEPNDKDRAIIVSIIQLVKNLGIKVLAEGVETKTQYDFLSELQCDEIQGFYYYKPMLPEELSELMK
jgi:diguanylate cyclase (GGDEF)-like protein